MINMSSLGTFASFNDPTGSTTLHRASTHDIDDRMWKCATQLQVTKLLVSVAFLTTVRKTKEMKGIFPNIMMHNFQICRL